MNKPEHLIQSEIRIALSPHAIMLRVNSGTFYQGKLVWDATRNQYILTNIRPVTGAPAGTSDLIGCRRSDGRFVAIECKTAAGAVRPDQIKFLDAMRDAHAVCGIARSAEDAIHIIEGNAYE